MKLLIIDDSPLLTDSLQLLLIRQPDPIESLVTTDILELKKQQPEYLPDIILLIVRDRSSERRYWTEIESLEEAYPASQLVVYSEQPVHLVKNYLRRGVKGFLSKKARFEDLVDCLTTVQKGNRYVEIYVLTQLTVSTGPGGGLVATIPLMTSLSTVEREVVQLLIQGKSHKAIAELINRNPSTVTDIKERILRKLDIPSISVLRQLAL